MTKIQIDDGKSKKITVVEKKSEKSASPAKKPAAKKITVKAPAKKITVNRVEKVAEKKVVAPKTATQPAVKKIEAKKTETKKAKPVHKVTVSAVSSNDTHSLVQKSTTLSRRYVKKPVSKIEVAKVESKPAETKPEIKAEIKPEVKAEAKPEIKAPEPAKLTESKTALQKQTEVAPAKNTIKIVKKSKNEDRALKAAARAVKKAQKIEKAEKRAEKKVRPEREFRKKSRGRRVFFAMVCSAATVAALVAFVNVNMPDISVRVAAMQTGIEATYPTFIPRNYSLSNVESDKDGVVMMYFDGPDGATFTLSEEKSTWDSTALLNNYVKKVYPSDYTTLREQGITIYTRGEKASWVNGGLLYKIEASGKYLTKEQIRNIATSL